MRDSSSNEVVLSFQQRPWLIWLLIGVDAVVLETCLGIGFGLRIWASQWFPFIYDTQTIVGLIAGVMMVPVALALAGVYPGFGLHDVERMRRVVTTIAVVFSSLIAWDYLVQHGQWSRGTLLATWVLATILIPYSFSWTRRLLIRFGHWGAPLIIIGGRDAAQSLIDLMSENPKLGYVPIGILDFDPSLVGTKIGSIPVVGSVQDAGIWARHVRSAAVAMPELEGEQLANLSARLPFPQVLLLPEFRGIQTSWVTPRDLNGVLGLEVKKNLLLRHNRLLKRAVDIVGASLLLAFSLPLLCVAALAIVVISPGSPFYRHEVTGRRNQPFLMIKLRTMYPNAKGRLREYLADNPEKRVEWLQFLKLRDDPRVLPVVGRFLRRSSIDELPQLWNVLCGEMSLVGPRPLVVSDLDFVDPDYVDFRSSVTPGITGLWQVETRSEGGLEDREAMDTYYIRNWSLWLDIYILFKTFPTVVSAKGAY